MKRREDDQKDRRDGSRAERRESDQVIRTYKKSLRRELLGILNALPPETRREGDARILRRVTAMPQYQKAGRIFVFVGSGWEVDTWPLIEEALADGKTVAVPRCLPLTRDMRDAGEGGVMEACLIRGRGDLLQRPPLGLWEPAEGMPVLAPEAVEFALIPCIACDRKGRRLGRGGGYYDRFLAGSGFTKVALCRQVMLREELPSEDFDETVDFIVTEDALFDFTGIAQESQQSDRS